MRAFVTRRYLIFAKLRLRL